MRDRFNQKIRDHIDRPDRKRNSSELQFSKAASRYDVAPRTMFPGRDVPQRPGDCTKKVWEVEPLECPRGATSLKDLAQVHQEGLGSRTAGVSQLQRRDEDSQFHQRRAGHRKKSSNSSGYGIEASRKPPPDNNYGDMIDYQPFDGGAITKSRAPR